MGPSVRFYDRRIWLPNSILYEIDCGENDELPCHVRDQAVLIFHSDVMSTDEDKRCGMLLYHQEDGTFDSETVLGCVVNLEAEDGNSGDIMASGISKLHVPPGSGLFESFKDLNKWARARKNGRKYYGFAAMGSRQAAIE